MVVSSPNLNPSVSYEVEVFTPEVRSPHANHDATPPLPPDLQAEIIEMLRQPQTAEILEILSVNNAWILEQIPYEAQYVTTAELFLLNIPQLPEIRFFPNLVTVKLMNINLRSMSDLKSLVHVKELWLSGNCITEIECIEQMTKLERLYLQDNLISSMAKLPVLNALSELWLCRNRITAIERLENIRRIRSLWLSENPISSLDGAFNHCLDHLRELNLAGCRVFLFNQITHLQPLVNLRRLWFNDALFGANPICRLQNYTTFVHVQLPFLEMLDSQTITKEQHAACQSLFRKKYIYYRMCLQRLEHYYLLLRRHLITLAEGCEERAQGSRHKLLQYLIPLKAELQERQKYNGKFAAGVVPDPLRTLRNVKQLEEVVHKLESAVGMQELQIQSVHGRLTDAVLAGDMLKSKYKDRLCLESNTGGNVRLEDVVVESPTSSHAWHKNMCKILLSRFDPSLYKQFGLESIKVNRICRTVNNGLRSRFDERVEELNVDVSLAVKNKGFMYLFSVIPTKPNEQLDIIHNVLLNGMDKIRCPGSTASSSVSNMREGVPLTNSIYYADEERLIEARKNHQLSSFSALSANDRSDALCGRVILSRVFLGKAVHALGGSNAKPSTVSGTNDSTPAASYIRSCPRVLKKDYSDDVFSVYRTPLSDNAHIKVWYNFDRTLILPECVIEFSYIPIVQPMVSPMLSLVFSMPAELKTELESLFSCPYNLSSVFERSTSSSGDSEGSRNSSGSRPDDRLHVPFTDASYAWICMRECGFPLVAAIHFYRTGIMEHIAKKEADAAFQAARLILKLPRTTLTPTHDSSLAKESTVENDSSGQLGPLQEGFRPLEPDMITEYCTQLGLLADGKSISSPDLVYCCLHRRSLSALSDDFYTPLLNSLLTLDLSCNGLVGFSFRALAKNTPILQYLFLQGNSLSRLELQGALLCSLKTLDLSYNLLQDVENLRDVVKCCPKLQSLSVQQNPFIRSQKNALYRLLSFFFCDLSLPRSSVKLKTLNEVPIKAGKNSTYWGMLINRTLTVQPFPSKEASAMLCEWVSGAAFSFLSAMRDYRSSNAHHRGVAQIADDVSKVKDPFSHDSDGIPERFYEASLIEVAAAAQETGASQSPTAEFEATTLLGNKSLEYFHEEFLSTVSSFAYNDSLLENLSWVTHYMRNLRRLALRNHNLIDISPFLQLVSLEELDVQGNCLEHLPRLSELPRLCRLNVSFNLITSLASMGVLPRLRTLCASGNAVTELESDLIAQLRSLEELYLASNQIALINNFYAIKDLPELMALEISGNPCMVGDTAPPNSPRRGCNLFTCYYVIYHFTNLKVLNGVPISQEELQSAHEEFAGRISTDLLEERAHASSSLWGTLPELDLSHCMLKEVSMINSFPALRLLKLNHNLLTQVDGVGTLRNLRALDLSFNRLGALAHSGSLGEALKPLSHLESLSLESNHITNLDSLLLDLPRLHFLNLKGNELQYLDSGFERLPRLIELILDQNKLRIIGPDCFTTCGNSLAILSAEENAIRSTEGLSGLKRLEQLSLGLNRLGDLSLLLGHLLASGGGLTEAVFAGNPLTRKSNYRQKVVLAFPRLRSLDRRVVSAEDRRRAELMKRSECVVPPNVFLDMGGLEAAPEGRARPPTLALPPRIGQPRSGAKSVGPPGVDAQPVTVLGTGGGERTVRGIAVPFPCVLRSLPVRQLPIPKPGSGACESVSQKNPPARSTKYFYPGVNR